MTGQRAPSSESPTIEEAKRPSLVDVPPGESFDLFIHPVMKSIEGHRFRMLSYNGSIPGTTLRVQQGSEILVNVINETDMETTVHWHGLRLENRYDGVPHETQAPIPSGGRYTHRLIFPDAGLFWYHPHMREDFAQEMGLYANILVDPTDPAYWPPVDGEVVLTLDDILIEDGDIAPFDPHRANFAAMGRYGNVLLVSGETEQRFDFRQGQVVRFYLTNTANTRVFRVAIPDVRMKLVGGDGGRYEREQWVDDVVIGPSERAIVDVLFDRSGTFKLEHATPDRKRHLATISVAETGIENSPAFEQFAALRLNADMVAERRRTARFLHTEPDKTLALIAEMDVQEPRAGESAVFVCPMHPEVVRDEPGTCPKCGMKLMPSTGPPAPMHHGAVAHGGGGHAHQADARDDGHDMPSQSDAVHMDHAMAGDPHVADSHSAHHHEEAPTDGIEWEDHMLQVNRATTSANMRWKVVDRETGKENAGIEWSFAAGEQVKIRLVNEMESDHPMHHPFHIHGQRFLVLARNDVEEPNLVWKDTVLIRTGETVDILLDAANPGLWMAHCHIPEHMESGMMFTFKVRARRA